MIKIRINNIDKYYDIGNGRTFTVSINPGYTCLVGPNGTGKTTMLKQIRDTLTFEKDEDSGKCKYRVLHYDNMQDGGSRNFGMWMMNGQVDKIAEVISSSEGEGIIFNIGEFAVKAGRATTECIKNNQKLVILIDGFDSGTSIDKIYQFKDQFVKTVIDHCKDYGVEVYIIATANTYAMVDSSLGQSVDCIIANSTNHKSFRTYNNFKNFIMSKAKQ